MNENEIKVRVWERGCGETLACGTGACATVVAGVLNSLCDVSDGLLADLGHIAERSGVCIDVRSEALGVGDPVASVAAAYGTDPMPWVLSGGHDHAFVGTLSADADVPPGFTRIGEVLESGDAGVTVDGAPWGGPTGHEHFAG